MPALRVKLSSVLVYDIAGKGFTRFTGAPGLESDSALAGRERAGAILRLRSTAEHGPAGAAASGNAAACRSGAARRCARLSTVFTGMRWAALRYRRERRVAEAALRDPRRPGRPSADGLADLLWAVMMTPEFQLIR